MSFDTLGIAFGLASLAGINLYLTTLLVGFAVHFKWIALSGAYRHLEISGNPWLIGAASVLFVIEFFADKIPWVDSAWDGIHTFIRPAGAMLLSVAAMGDANPVLTGLGTLLAGTTALTTHSAKASSRLIVNASPEPVSNSVASIAEDVGVIGGATLLLTQPWIAVSIFAVFVILCAVFVIVVFRKVRHRFTRTRSALA